MKYIPVFHPFGVAFSGPNPLPADLSLNRPTPPFAPLFPQMIEKSDSTSLALATIAILGQPPNGLKSSAPLTGKASNLTNHRNNIAIIFQKRVQPRLYQRIWPAAQPELQFLQCHHAHRNPGNPVGLFQGARIGLMTSEFTDDIGISQVDHSKFR